MYFLKLAIQNLVKTNKFNLTSLTLTLPWTNSLSYKFVFKELLIYDLTLLGLYYMNTEAIFNDLNRVMRKSEVNSNF